MFCFDVFRRPGGQSVEKSAGRALKPLPHACSTSQRCHQKTRATPVAPPNTNSCLPSRRPQGTTRSPGPSPGPSPSFPGRGCRGPVRRSDRRCSRQRPGSGAMKWRHAAHFLCKRTSTQTSCRIWVHQPPFLRGVAWCYIVLGLLIECLLH